MTPCMTGHPTACVKRSIDIGATAPLNAQRQSSSPGGSDAKPFTMSLPSRTGISVCSRRKRMPRMASGSFMAPNGIFSASPP